MSALICYYLLLLSIECVHLLHLNAYGNWLSQNYMCIYMQLFQNVHQYTKISAKSIYNSNVPINALVKNSCIYVLCAGVWRMLVPIHWTAYMYVRVIAVYTYALSHAYLRISALNCTWNRTYVLSCTSVYVIKHMSLYPYPHTMYITPAVVCVC